MKFFKKAEQPQNGELIVARGVSLSYEGKVVASGLDFCVRRGDYLCIVGDNGSGKSTLLKAIIGLKALSAGELLIDEKAKRGGIGYLPQITPGESDFPASVKEIVLSGCLGRMGNRPFPGKYERRAAQDIMGRLGLTELADRPFSKLSGGQQQKVLLARAYCATEDMILLDEPISGLDPDAAQEMYSLIAHLNREHGQAVVMVSHDTEGAMKYATSVLHVGGVGGKNFFGSKDEYIKWHSTEHGSKAIDE